MACLKYLNKNLKIYEFVDLYYPIALPKRYNIKEWAKGVVYRVNKKFNKDRILD